MASILSRPQCVKADTFRGVGIDISIEKYNNDTSINIKYYHSNRINVKTT